MRVWSFQRESTAAEMQSRPRFHASWEYVESRWQPAYRWMVRAMEERGVSTGGHPPIWACQACSPDGGPPTLETARSLLSDAELEHGVIVVELEVPASSLVLSSYGDWNAALDHTIDHGTEPPDAFRSMFDVSRRRRNDDIQACLPYVEKDWIVATRPLDLRADDGDDWARLA
jgi:hypothetical protein